MYTQYQIRNLAELLEAAQAIINEVQAEEQISSIDPAEILIDCEGWDNFTLIARSHTLTDKSKVYDVVVPIAQKEHSAAVIAPKEVVNPSHHGIMQTTWTNEVLSHSADCAQRHSGECTCGAFEHNQAIEADDPRDGSKTYDVEAN